MNHQISCLRNILVYSILSIILTSCGSPKEVNEIRIEGKTFVSVKTFGAVGDGQADDTPAIQRALDAEERVYFPPGDYRIATATNKAHNPACLRITENTLARQLEFAEGARLYLDNNFNHDFKTFVVLKIFADAGDVSEVSIRGLNIFAESRLPDGKFTGVKAIEHRGNQILHLRMENTSITNLGGAGIITYATKTTLLNTRTENLGSHGIGARNPYNLGIPHELYIDGHESYNDQAYSIDFSGTQIGNDPSTADPRDSWKGVARNIKSVNALRGIKTAGHWDLHLENVHIVGSGNYGFFINKDAPNHTITIKDLTVERARLAGMSLSGKTQVNMQNIKIIDCPEGLLLQRASVNIDTLLIDGKGRCAKGLRIPNDAVITNFAVTGITGQYPIWIIRGDVQLRHGQVYNNEGAYSLLIKETAGDVLIDDVQFYDDRAKPKQQFGVLNQKKVGRVEIKDLDESGLQKHQ